MQIGCERSAADNWFGCREPHEFAIAQLNERNEKVVIGGKKIGRDREIKDDFLAGNRTLSQGLLVGLLLMPFSTELFTVKVLERTLAINFRSAVPLLRELKATSEREFTRVGTLPLGGNAESLGNTR